MEKNNKVILLETATYCISYSAGDSQVPSLPFISIAYSSVIVGPFLQDLILDTVSPLWEMDGWMICHFTSFSAVFQSYQNDGQMMKTVRNGTLHG